VNQIVLRNGILKSTKDVEIFNTYVLIHDMIDGWITYKVPKQLYKKFKRGAISYWDMCFDKSTKSW